MISKARSKPKYLLSLKFGRSKLPQLLHTYVTLVRGMCNAATQSHVHSDDTLVDWLVIGSGLLITRHQWRNTAYGLKPSEDDI